MRCTPLVRRTIVIGAFTIAFILLPLSAEATTYYWVGGNGDSINDQTNWDTSDPAACNDGGGDSSEVPGTNDVVIFDPDCDNNAVIDSSWSVLGVRLNNGYAGTVTQNNSITLTVGTSDWIQAAGTFTGGDSTIDVNDDFTMTGGTFTATTGTWELTGNLTVGGGTFAHNSGSLTITDTSTVDIGSNTLNNVTLDTVSDNRNLNITGTMDVNGDLTITSIDEFLGGTLTLAGDVIVTDAATALGTTLVKFDGGGDQNWSAGGGTGDMPGDIEIDKSGGALIVSDTIKVPGDWTHTNGTVSGAGTIQFIQTSTITSGSFGNNVEIAMGASNWNTTIAGPMNVDGNFTITSVSDLSGSGITVAGNLTSTDTSISNGITITSGDYRQSR